MCKETYTIESDNNVDIKLAVNARNIYCALESHQQRLRSLWKYGKSDNADWEGVIDDLYHDLCDSLNTLGIE